MCGWHWTKVPSLVQLAVWEAFNPLQCQQVEDRPRPTGAWMVAADVAILAVWLWESTEVPPLEARGVCYRELLGGAWYAHRMGEDWRSLLLNMQRRVPANYRALHEVLEQLLQHAELPERGIEPAQSTRVD